MHRTTLDGIGQVSSTLLVISVAAFDLAIVLGRLWPDRLMVDVEPAAEKVKRMNAISFG